MSTFFSLVSSRAFTDAPHSHFRCGDPNQWLPYFLKMLLSALPEIYTRLFIWTVVGWEILARINFLFSRKFSRVERCATLAF